MGSRAPAILKAIAPEAGSYVSESNFFNANWRQLFRAPNYARLAAIEAKYDPDTLSPSITASAAKPGATTQQGLTV